MKNKKGVVVWTALVLMGMAVLMNIFGGIGTSCVAFNLDNYPKFSMIADYQWMWQTFVIVTTLIGFTGLVVLVQLFKGGKNSFRYAIYILILGAIVGGMHMFASASIIGKAVPANVKFFANVAALIVFTILALPGLKKYRDVFSSGGSKDKKTGAGITAIVAGLVLITMPIWAGPSHMIGEANLVNVLGTEIMIISVVLFAVGAALLAGPALVARLNRVKADMATKKLES